MFLNLVMLAGLGGAVLPLVLHLLARSRYRTVEWGATMFLDDADPAEARNARLRQFTLLAVRMGMVGLLAAALARPVVRSQWSASPLGEAGRVTAVILLDRSASMGFEEGGRSRFDRAREAALQILATLRKGDEVSLVLLGEQTEVIYPEPTTNLQAAAREIADLQVSPGAGNLPEALARARAILESPTRIHRELYLLTDRQAVNWQPLEGDAGRELREWAQNPANPTRLFVLPVGGQPAENVAVESIALLEPPAIRGQASEVEVRVRNFGPTPQPDLQLALTLTSPADPPRRLGEPGRLLRAVPLNVNARSSTTLRLPLHFDRPGSHVLSAEINAPGLREDNRLDAAIDVIDPLDVLVLSGDERGPEPSRKSFYLRAALAPHQSTRTPGADPAVVTVRPFEELPRLDLSKYRVIVLANVPQLTPDQVRRIEQRVYDGGGLVIAPGNLTRIDPFNRELYRDGQGLMPARLDPPTPADGSRATIVHAQEAGHPGTGHPGTGHPLLRFAHGADDAALAATAVTRYFPATPRAWDATVVATYASGDPFVVEGPRGRGRVLLLTTPLDADWSTLPLSRAFLPFVQAAARYAGAQPSPSRNLAPGEPIVATFDEPVDPGSIELTRGDERLAGATYLSVRNQVRFADTLRPGLYRVRAKVRAPNPERVLHFVVQAPRRESDLTPLDDARWRSLRESLDFDELDPAPDRVAATLGAMRSGHELWLPLVLSVLALGVLELWLTRRWSPEVA